MTKCIQLSECIHIKSSPSSSKLGLPASQDVGLTSPVSIELGFNFEKL